MYIFFCREKPGNENDSIASQALHGRQILDCFTVEILLRILSDGSSFWRLVILERYINI